LDELLNHITLVHINRNDGDDLDTELRGEISSHTLDQVTDSRDSHEVVLLHSGFGTTVLKLFEGALGLFSPHDLRGEERGLRVVVIEPSVAWLSKVPLFSGLLRHVKVVFEGGDHLELKVAEVVLDGALADELSEEGNVFATVFRVHAEGGLVRLRTNLLEFEVAETVEAVSNLLVDLHGVVTVGQDIK
jgi:hypothetical protein